MKVASWSFDLFNVGDRVVFDRTFSADDFAAFSALSGDSNPLHHSVGYANATGFDAPIVPLHMVLAPLSMIAGMVFPGEPSLYLNHEVHALRPVRYGAKLRYSARVTSINQSHRVLTIRVLAISESVVVLDAAMSVQARAASWSSVPALPIQSAEKPGTALITGATGAIGSATALLLARAGWNLILQDRGNATKRENLQRELAGTVQKMVFVNGDLADEAGRKAVCAAVTAADDIGLIVHAASPPVFAPVDQLVAVNFVALKHLIDAALPSFLLRQEGAIILIGSRAADLALPGWEAYAGAKVMAHNLLEGVGRTNSPYGIRVTTIAPSFVATEFSKELRSAEQPALSPIEVAEHVIQSLGDRRSTGDIVMIEPGKAIRGRFGFYTETTAPSSARVRPNEPAVRGEEEIEKPAQPSETDANAAVASIVRRVLRLPADYNLSGGGLGTTPAWDSLKHIEVVLRIESDLGLHFDSGEIEATHSFEELEKLCRRKRSSAA